MVDRLEPRDAGEVEEAVRWALAHDTALDVRGAGSKRGIGRPSQSGVTLDLSGLSGITLYEPEELVLSARAGTPVTAIAALLAQQRQELAFEPPDLGPVLGGAAGQATIGGILAANLSGPRRMKAGAARDHFLGVTAVSGRGETFKSGGRVVKNVTGYDLCKLLAGSWGTLAAMTEVTLKVLPRAETERTLLLYGLAPDAAVSAMTAALGSPADVSAAAHLPAPLAGRIATLAAREAVTAMRIEGVAPSVAHRIGLLEGLLRSHGPAARLEEAASQALWRAVRDLAPFVTTAAEAPPLWRLCVPPADGARVAARIAAQAEADCLFDWGGGLIWVQLAARADAGAAVVREALRPSGGHATLIRAPAAVRATVAVFEPEDARLAALTRRVKEGFDPRRVLNPGRMWAGV